MEDHRQNIIESLELLALGLIPEGFKPNKMRLKDRIIYWFSCSVWYGGCGFFGFQLVKWIFF